MSDRSENTTTLMNDLFHNARDQTPRESQQTVGTPHTRGVSKVSTDVLPIKRDGSKRRFLPKNTLSQKYFAIQRTEKHLAKL